MPSVDRIHALEAIIVPVCAAHGVELVEARLLQEKGGSVLRVMIDRERADGAAIDGSGVSLDDCTNVSRDLSTALDVHEDLIPGRYRLEVSSPGLDRPLTKLEDYERFQGREIKIQTKAPIGDRRRFQGVLRGLNQGEVELEQDGTPVRIPYPSILRANLVYRF